MQEQINVFDILVKTLKRKAKSLTRTSDLAYNLALEIISKEYGFDHWHDLTQLRSYVLVHFPERPSSYNAAFLNSLLEEKGFSRMSPDAGIHPFIAHQSLLRHFDFKAESDSLGEDAETYLLRDTQHIESLDNLKASVLYGLSNVQYHVIYKGILYPFDTLTDDIPEVVEYAYFKEDG